MPLTKPARRTHRHSRQIDCRGYEREDGLWDIEARLMDSKTYSFENKDRGYIASGEPLHEMWIRLTVDEDLLVHKAEAATDAGPFTICGDITSKFAALEGLKIAPGWRRAVLERMGGVNGCTHLTDLLVGPMAVAAFHTVQAARSKRAKPDTEGGKPALLDTCHALASDSPVIARDWPAYYKKTRSA